MMRIPCEVAENTLPVVMAILMRTGRDSVMLLDSSVMAV
jgi:hypothetical protein